MAKPDRKTWKPSETKGELMTKILNELEYMFDCSTGDTARAGDPLKIAYEICRTMITQDRLGGEFVGDIVVNFDPMLAPEMDDDAITD